MMTLFKHVVVFLAVALGGFGLFADGLTPMTWTVDGVVREALVYIPADAKKSARPLVFVFHGHFGTSKWAADAFGIEKLWPEAIVVYMQGLKTPGKLTDPEGKGNGWQGTIGEAGDRDFHFFDAVLATLKKDFLVDEKKIFSTGHSNGGQFTYLLWAYRGEIFRAFAPSAAVPGKDYTALKAKAVLHVAGEKDTLVKYEWQVKTIGILKKLNECGEGGEWGRLATFYPSKNGNPLVTYIHPEGHTFPKEAPAAIVKFFQEMAK